MSAAHHAMSQLWKRMGAVFGTFHFHVTEESGFEAGCPSLHGACWQAHVGDGGGGRDRLMCCLAKNLDVLVHCSSPSLFMAPAYTDS